MVLVGEIWAIAVQQTGLSGYEMSLIRVEHECYGVALEVEVELGVVACGPVGRCNSSYAELVSPTLVFIR